ncbi:MAG: hypothetical protein SFZ03_01185 [Candidatus Melainabacteria bacterium]|nr:hypothetical protein [Candidatus Melainabacteria bacterium]
MTTALQFSQPGIATAGRSASLSAIPAGAAQSNAPAVKFGYDDDSFELKSAAGKAPQANARFGGCGGAAIGAVAGGVGGGVLGHLIPILGQIPIVGQLIGCVTGCFGAIAGAIAGAFLPI